MYMKKACLTIFLAFALTPISWAIDTDPNSVDNQKVEKKLDKEDQQQIPQAHNISAKARQKEADKVNEDDDIQAERNHDHLCFNSFKLPGYDEIILKHRGDEPWFLKHMAYFQAYINDYKKLHKDSLNASCGGDVFTLDGDLAPLPQDLGRPEQGNELD